MQDNRMRMRRRFRLSPLLCPYSDAGRGTQNPEAGRLLTIDGEEVQGVEGRIGRVIGGQDGGLGPRPQSPLPCSPTAIFAQDSYTPEQPILKSKTPNFTTWTLT